MLSIGIPIGIPEGLLPTPEADMATTTRRFAFKNAFKQDFRLGLQFDLFRWRVPKKGLALYHLVPEDLLGHELEHVRFIRGHVTYMVLELHSGKDTKCTLVSCIFKELLAKHEISETIDKIMKYCMRSGVGLEFNNIGAKGKRVFINTQLYDVIYRACRKLHKQVGEVGFEDAVARALKHAPNKKGGYRFKVIEIIHCQWF
ncbi:hypothetical protein GQR58_007619 [Nymphon striatum]|nr:hypothetical protein GQR58_007619 [Nymphon striatum]